MPPLPDAAAEGAQLHRVGDLLLSFCARLLLLKFEGQGVNLVCKDLHERGELALHFYFVLAVGKNLADECVLVEVHQPANGLVCLHLHDFFFHGVKRPQLELRHLFVLLTNLFLVKLGSAQDFDALQHEDLLNILQVDEGQAVELRVALTGLQFEDLRCLGNVFLPLGFENRHAFIPHLQRQLLHQILEVFQHHGFDNFEIEVGVDAVFALDHEKLNFDPHIDRF
mmetsp:Transcript_43527/g.57614  ORF Transcript_43527/g.57614 Transcript_43527/m.57614 type:complete len:225 (-) Transcript_43527:571-1245(-)|eukprot:CAMPEP_0185570504 /NCGR_PEP_ID=MMETSP0434-20130131/2795_1 /TAXON_ID=626734 ORGANISM="Favella taraikaensis, Strain Fe Narragansett Bay" /NCGR_SAMPLE_ID=MMETSP0434 /ASSEMBLY_ACC=CAM_ASM_000379 /LENGTH=224 /DNA_ID=CAMNT_0028185645 /DNA_START=1174 /DNA_END=1848 /DNA_ORIENTATION=+